MIPLFAAAFFWLALTPTVVHAAEPMEIRVATPKGPPHQEPTFYPDLWRAIEAEIPGLKVIYYQGGLISTLRVEAEIAEGTLDATAGFLKTPERLKKFNFSATPLMRVYVGIVQRSDDPIRIESWDDLAAAAKGASFIDAINGSPPARMLTERGIPFRSEGFVEYGAYLKLLNQRPGHLLVGNSHSLAGTIAKTAHPEKFRLTNLPGTEEYTYIVYSKKFSPVVREKIERVLASFYESGRINEILDAAQ